MVPVPSVEVAGATALRGAAIQVRPGAVKAAATPVTHTPVVAWILFLALQLKNRIESSFCVSRVSLGNGN